jgi:hypothetical protein
MKHVIVALSPLFLGGWVGFLALASSATAADLPCGPAEKGTVELDGLTEDWKDVDGVDAGGRDANLSFTLKCNVDPTSLLMLIDVRDNYFVRTKQAKPGEDHLELTLGGHKLTIFPGNSGDLKDKIVPKPPKGMKVVSALQPQGWAIELAIPLKDVPGYKPGAPTVKYAAKVADCDSKAVLKTERTVDTVGNLVFGEGQSNLDGFLKDRKLQPADVFFDKSYSFGKREGGRVVLAGRYAAVIAGDGFAYIELPFRDRKDLKDARVLDLAGDGRDALVLRWTERGSAGPPTHGGGAAGPVSGSRELLAAWRFNGENVQRVFAAEVGKQQGANKIENKVSFVRRGRATDIVIEAGPASGFTQASYHEAAAEDVIPVLLPWGDDKKAHYVFRGDEYSRK